MIGVFIVGRIANRCDILNVMTFGISLLAVTSLMGCIFGLFYLGITAVGVPIIFRPSKHNEATAS